MESISFHQDLTPRKYEEEIRNLETQTTLQPWLAYIQDKEVLLLSFLSHLTIRKH
jgi:hypothetical protein